MAGSAPAPPEGDELKETCWKHLDALWFCYSPVYQSTQYYRQGEFDTCLGKWGSLFDCMLLRTAAAPRIKAKLEAQAEVERAAQVPHIWVLRSAEEAQRFWTEEFPSGAARPKAE